MITTTPPPASRRRLPVAPLVLAALAALTPLSAQIKPAPAPAKAAPVPAKSKALPVVATVSDVAKNDDIIVLSPFEVVADTKGYFASNTMSGTRLNSKIEDLGQSITVMTKEQMSDFAMLDINDVFDHMASTEGTGSYSLFETDRTGAVVDQVNLNPNNANRVRGISNANVAFNNIAMTGRVPVDPLWMEAFELSRGPNANIFGLGNASGTVNQVPVTANVYRDFTKVEIRSDSYGGWRGSIDTNRVLVKDKFAIRASYAKEHIGFIRKPSGEDHRRISFQVKVKPAKNTTISLSYFGFKASAVRPNFTTPRDYYTDWFKLGKPGWNPVTRLITKANGEVYGNLNTLGSTTPYTSTPTFFITNGGTDTRSPFLIGAPGEAPYWTMARYTANPATPVGNNYSTTDPFASSASGIGLLVLGSSDTYTASQQPLYNSVARPIESQAIYDWTKINLAGNSKAWDDVKIYLAQVDQIFLNTRKQTLAAQFTMLREDAKRLENQPMGPASVNSNVGQLEVDVNQVNLDGTPNPYFGRPFLKVSEPFLRDKPWLWDTARAQAVYKLDFTQDKGWSKWFGTQQLLGYYEYKDQKNYLYNYRHTALGLDKGWEQKYAALNAPLGLQSNANVNPLYLNTPTSPTTAGTVKVPGGYARLSENYYVGSTPGGGIEYAPSYFPEGASVPFVWGPSSGAMIKDVSAIGWTPVPGGGLNNLNTVIKTTGAVLQSTFLDGRLVGTFGLRKDKVYDRNSPLALLTPDLRAFDRAASDQWAEGAWREAAGNTQNISIVARPFRGIAFLERQVSGGSGVSKFLAEAISSLNLTYNKSENFIAQGPAYDLFLNKLPNQTGTGKDIGFWMTMMDGNLTIRYTHYDNMQLNLRNGDISTMAQRILRYEGFVADDAYNLRKQATAWLSGLGTGGTATNEQIAAAIKMPLAQYNGLQTIGANGTYAAVNDMRSKGDELEINFNPIKAWTVSASVTKTESINTAAGAAVDEYIAARKPIWETLEDPRYKYVSTSINTTVTPNVTTATYNATIGGVTAPVTSTITSANPVIPNGTGGNLLWWNIMGAPFTTLSGYNATSTPALNFAGNVDAPMAVFRALIGRPRPQMRKYSAKFNTRYNLSGITDNNILKNITVGGSVRYATKASIGFYGLGYTQGMDLTLAANKILKLDENRPIYSAADTFVDLFVSYRTKLYHDKVKATFQLNVKNVNKGGGDLQATGAFFDGRTQTYRILDPRQFILSASFEL
jgi:hypothetical protein